jgi:hypothetical protein
MFNEIKATKPLRRQRKRTEDRALTGGGWRHAEPDEEQQQ